MISDRRSALAGDLQPLLWGTAALAPQDLQFFWNGNSTTIRPIRVEALFDGSPDSPQLSDHDGFMVT